MLTERKEVTREKIIYALGRIVPYFVWWISTSVYISSADKDRLTKQLNSIKDELLDAHQRSKGVNPERPEARRQREKREAEQRKRLQNL